MSKTIRWHQRYENLSKSFNQLEAAVLKKDLNNLEKSGLVQVFNLTFELSWKTLKDYIESKGLVEKFPRDVIKTCFQADIIENGHVWIEMLDKRNEFAHLYDENAILKTLEKIKNEYYLEIKKIICFFESKKNEPS